MSSMDNALGFCSDDNDRIKTCVHYQKLFSFWIDNHQYDTNTQQNKLRSKTNVSV